MVEVMADATMTVERLNRPLAAREKTSSGRTSERIALPSKNLKVEFFKVSALDVTHGRDTVRMPPLLPIEGENFEVIVEAGGVRLRHPMWSLTGRGRSLSDAEQSLYENVRILLPVYRSKPINLLSEQAKQMLEFMIRFS